MPGKPRQGTAAGAPRAARGRTLRVVDLFCGGGGTSTGLALGLKAMGHELGQDVRLCAINHWAAAVATHQENHPWAEHRCESVEAVDRTTIFPGQRLDLLVASPECTHWSAARGAKPIDNQKRAGAWFVLDWIGDRRPAAVLIENVPDFTRWGKVEKGKQLRHTEGSVFKAYLQAFRALGYNVAWDILNAADYGAATSRRRMFIMAKRGRKPLHWPQPTHNRHGINGLKKWRAAKEILDFTLPSQSIFGRSRPLAQRTLDRIAKGIRDGPHGPLLDSLARAVETCSGPVPLAHLLSPEGIAQLEQAWTLGQQGGATARPADSQPLATIPGGGALRLIEALIIGAGGPARQGEPRDGTAGPLPALLAQNRLALVDAILVHLKGTSTTRSPAEPVPSLQAGGEHVALAETFILPPEGVHRGNKARPVDSEPVQALTRRGGGHLVEPRILHLTHGTRDHDPNAPLPGVTGANRGELALADAALLLPNFGEREGQALRVRRPSEGPLHTIHSAGAGSLAFLASYYGNGDAAPVTDPLGTLTARDRFALVEALLEDFLVDVRLRMLHPKELAAAMGFPASYKFHGNRTQVVKQIGNAVEVNIARALVASLLEDAPQPVLDVLGEADTAEAEVALEPGPAGLPVGAEAGVGLA